MIKNNQNKMIKYYEINWSNVKTIKDIKCILAILATKVVIDHNDDSDIKIFNELKNILIETTED